MRRGPQVSGDVIRTETRDDQMIELKHNDLVFTSVRRRSMYTPKAIIPKKIHSV